MATRRTTTTTRESKMTSRKGDATEDAPEKKGGLTMVDAIAIVTALIMLAAILVTDYHLGHDLGTGMFFKGH